MSKSTISKVPEQDSNSKYIILPYKPGYIYAATPSDEACEDLTVTFYHSIPNILKDCIHILDVSSAKVKIGIN